MTDVPAAVGLSHVLLYAVIGCFVILLATVVVGVIIIKRGAKQGKLLLVGKRPSTGRLVFRWAKAVRGGYTWKEPGDFEAYVPLDNAFLWDSNWGRVVFVDLDSYHPVRYLGEDGNAAPAANVGRRAELAGSKNGSVADVPAEPDEKAPQVVDGIVMPTRACLTIAYDGKCTNDEDKTMFYDRKGAQVGSVTGLWRRLPGTRLAQIRKDTRMQQMNEMLGGVLAQLMKYVPLIAILTFVTVLIVLGFVAHGAMPSGKHG